MPGAMARAARERLVSLSAERTQVIEEIQRGLVSLKLYKGEVDGKRGEERRVRCASSPATGSGPIRHCLAAGRRVICAPSLMAINAVAGKVYLDAGGAGGNAQGLDSNT